MKYKAVIADVDGTLIAPNAGPLTIASQNVISAVHKAVGKGIYFSIATARSINWITGLVESLHVNAPLILDNGARIYDPKTQKYLFESYLSERKVIEVLAVLKKYNVKITLVPHENELARFDYVEGEKYALDDLVKIIVLHISSQLSESVYQSLTKLDGIQVTKSISGHSPIKESVHVTSFNAAKGKALQWITHYLHISKDEIIGIGDSYNDEEFLKECGLKVAMGNSVPEILKIADYIAPSYEEDGVADVLDKFILK